MHIYGNIKSIKMGLFDLFKKENKEPFWDLSIPKVIRNMMLDAIKKNPQSCSQDEIPQGFGRFGIDKTNPIPICGVSMNEQYLSSLRRITSSEKVRWRRI